MEFDRATVDLKIYFFIFGNICGFLLNWRNVRVTTHKTSIFWKINLLKCIFPLNIIPIKPTKYILFGHTYFGRLQHEDEKIAFGKAG